MSSQYNTAWNKPSADKFQKMWDEAGDPDDSHPYLVAKGIKPNGVAQIGDNLIIPVYINKKIAGIQTIDHKGEKKFVAESKISGGYYDINPQSPADTIYILEGFAKAVSVADATNKLTFCAFNAGNLPKCSAVVRERYPDAKIIIGADGDRDGTKFADEAALAVGGLVCYAPEGKDFGDVCINDYPPTQPVAKVEVVREIKDYSNYDDDFDKATIEEMLSHISADIPYHEWIEIGMALKAGGAGLGVWDVWSKGSAKYKKNDCYNHWNSFKSSGIGIGTLVHHATLNGWVRKYEVVAHKKMANVDIGSLVASSEAKKKRTLPIPLKIDVMAFDGLIGDTVKWITDTATFKQPMLATLNVLAALGAVFGRKYASRLNTRTNIYTVGVAGTGLGKEASRRAIANLCNEAGLKDILGDNGVRSDSGMVKSLSVQSSQIMMIDEFGDFLKGLKDTKAASHIKAVSRLLLQLYSTSSSLYKHGTYATDKMDSMILHCPNLCIYGTTTEDIYAASISKEGIKSGELNRFIVLPGDDNASPCHDANDTQDIPKLLVEAWAALNVNPTGNNLSASNGSAFAPKPFIIGWGDCWQKICDLLDYQHCKRNELNGSLWVRYRENIIKIAMIYCLSEHKTELEHKHIETARYYVELSIKYMDKLANSHMADNQWEELHNEFIHVLEKNKGEMRKVDLVKAMKKVRRRDFNEMLESMKDAETIHIEGRTNEGSVGRPTVYVKLL